MLSPPLPPSLPPQSACAPYVKDESLWIASSASRHAKCYGVQGAKGMIECRNHCGYAACEHVRGAYCSTGATEVTIDNAEENEVVLSLFGKLSTEEASLNGMQLSTRSRHANWANGEPQNVPSSGTWCAVIQSNGLWASRVCSEKAVCLCQFDLPSPPSPPPSPYTPPSTASPPPLTESTDSGDADVVLPVAIAGGSIAAVMAAIICVVFLRRRRRDNLLNSGQVVSERAVRESHPVIAPDGDVSLATKTTP